MKKIFSKKVLYILFILTSVTYLFLCYKLNYSVASKMNIFELLLCGIGCICPIIMVYGMALIIYKILET